MNEPASNIDAAAESSAAATSSSPVDIEALHANDPAAYERWKLTGEAPASDASAESSPATSAKEQTASTDAKAQVASEASAPGAVEPKPGTPEYKAKTKERMDAILEENRQLKARLESRDRVAVPEAKPKADPNAKIELKELIDNPNPTSDVLTDDAFFEQYPDARFTDYQLYLANHVVAKRDHARSESERQHQAVTERKERLDAFTARVSDPEFLKSVIELPLPVDFLPAGTVPSARNIVAQEIMHSENSKAMWQGLTQEDLATVDRMTDWAAVVRFCARLEARVTGEPVKAAAKPGTQSKTVSDAPAPGTEIGSKAKSPSDPIQAALEDDDFVKYRDLANAQEMAKFKK